MGLKFLYYVCHSAIAPKYFRVDDLVDNDDTVNLAKGDNDTIETQLLLKEIQNKIDEEKIFTKPHLTIRELAQELDLSPRKLSGLINQEMSTNFYEFINRKRVGFVKEMLLQEEFDHFNLQSIGYDAGFNSKSAFYSTFKKFEGMTPLQYKSKHKA